MKHLFAGLMLALLAPAALAQTFFTPPPQISTTNYPPAILWQANTTLTAATSLSLVTANVTTNFGTYPTVTPGYVIIFNSGANPATICLQGGTCSATNGYVLNSGLVKTFYLPNVTTFPSAFSTSGTTLSLING